MLTGCKAAAGILQDCKFKSMGESGNPPGRDERERLCRVGKSSKGLGLGGGSFGRAEMNDLYLREKNFTRTWLNRGQRAKGEGKKGDMDPRGTTCLLARRIQHRWAGRTLKSREPGGRKGKKKRKGWKNNRLLQSTRTASTPIGGHPQPSF